MTPTPTPPPMTPCPFCGHDKPRIDGPDDDRPDAPSIIVCPECGCSSDYEDTVSEARDAWNKRTPATPPDLSRELTAENVQALEDLQKRFDHHRDWNQQRYNALRKWVDDEVKPLSAEVHHRYYSIIANGSPSPHESADWSGTLHAITLQRDAAQSEANRLRCDLAGLLSALRKCLGVLAGLDLNKSALIDALESGRAALSHTETAGGDGR